MGKFYSLKVFFKPVLQDLKSVVDAAQGHLVKVTLETGLLNSQQIGIACKAAETAGAQFVKDSSGLYPSQHPMEDARAMANASPLHLELGQVYSLEECKLYNQELGHGRRLRFASAQAPHIAQQEAKEYSEVGAPAREQLLKEAFKSPQGKQAVGEFKELRNKFLTLIDEAHAQGQPFVFSSTCVRPNDTSGTFEHNMGIREELLRNIEVHGYSYTDPFAVEGAQFLRDKSLPPILAQELLMDPEVGFWPELLSKCDAIAHGPSWKYSIGAREEDIIARTYGVPVWDGHSPIALRTESDRQQSMRFIHEAANV